MPQNRHARRGQKFRQLEHLLAPGALSLPREKMLFRASLNFATALSKYNGVSGYASAAQISGPVEDRTHYQMYTAVDTAYANVIEALAVVARMISAKPATGLLSVLRD